MHPLQTILLILLDPVPPILPQMTPLSLTQNGTVALDSLACAINDVFVRIENV